MTDADVLVAGGGAAGLFTAHYLRERGASVIVVERGAIGGPQSCSAGNTGFVGTQGSAPLAVPGARSWRSLLSPAGPLRVHPSADPELWRWVRRFRAACTADRAAATTRVLYALKRHSLALLTELSPDHFRAPGIVLAYRTPAAYASALAAASGSPVPLRPLGPAELAALDPDAAYAVAGALYNEEGAYLQVPGFLRAFAGRLSAAGATLLENTELSSLSPGRETVAVRLTSRTAPGREEVRELRAGAVVVAAGSWSRALAREAGTRIALQPVKGHAITVKAGAGAPRLPAILAEGPVAIAPLGDELRFAGALDLTGFDDRVSARRVERMLAMVRSHLPGLELAGRRETWTGLRPCTPDGLPYVGRAAPGIFLCCGHGPIGMGLSPATGRLLAQELTGERPDLDLNPFRVDR